MWYINEADFPDTDVREEGAMWMRASPDADVTKDERGSVDAAHVVDALRGK